MWRLPHPSRRATQSKRYVELMELGGAYDSILFDLAGGFSLILLLLAGVVCIVWDLFENDDPVLPMVASMACVVAIAWEARSLDAVHATVFYHLIRAYGLAAYINITILFGALATIILSAPYLKRIGRGYGEVYALILFATAGAVLLASANSLIAAFVGLETMSISLYILAGLVRQDEGSIESALKYFLLGAFATGFFLYGIGLLYGATGTMYLPELAAHYDARGSFSLLFWAGAALFLTGLLFKVSAVPFHMWTPDVYQGAPTPLTAYMSTASKAAAFAALILVLYYGLGNMPVAEWQTAMAVVALVTMVLGNLLALVQNNVKRMLAYSSIAHAGYVLVAITAGTGAGYAGAVYYLLIYSVMNIGAFGVMALLEWDGKEGRLQTIDSLSGIGFRRPLLGVVMGIFMFSLIGFPPLGGFFGKVAVFTPAIEAGYTWLAIVGVLASALSGYYYLRVLYVFWMRPDTEAMPVVRERDFPVPISSASVLVVCAVVLLAIGFVPLIRDLPLAYFDVSSLAVFP